MASSAMTSWQIDGEKMEIVTDFLFLGSKITADSDCSHEIKRCLLNGRKAMTNLDGILKSRDIAFPTKVCTVKAMVFPAVMYGGKSWIVKKAEGWRIDAFELWCWKRLLGVPWTARRSRVNPKGNQHCIFIGTADAEAPTLWLSDKSWLIGKKNLDSGKDWGEEEKGATEDEMVRWHHRLNGHEFEQTLGDGEGQGSLVCWSMGLQRVRYDLTTEQQQVVVCNFLLYGSIDLLGLTCTFLGP